MSRPYYYDDPYTEYVYVDQKNNNVIPKLALAGGAAGAGYYIYENPEKSKNFYYKAKDKLEEIYNDLVDDLSSPAPSTPREDPPREDPPREDPPREDPPREDPPREDPPKEDPLPFGEDPPPPREDPPKNDNGIVTGIGETDYPAVRVLDIGAGWNRQDLESRGGGIDSDGTRVITYNVSQYSPSEQQAARKWFDHYEEVANVRFVEVTGDLRDVSTGNYRANINFEYKPPDGPGWANSTFPSSRGTRIRMPEGEDYSEGTFAFRAMGHEIGHSMGLIHPNDNGYASGFNNDQSIMSYYVARTETETLQPLDIRALQSMYGANRNHNSGNNTYRIRDERRTQTIWDGGGQDKFDSSSYNGNSLINIQNYARSDVGRGSYFVAGGANIENVKTGNGNDTIKGNHLANQIEAGGGNDHIRGYSGDDRLYGGSGSDQFYFSKGMDQDTIYDFSSGDQLVFDNNLFSNPNDVLSNIQYRNGNAYIDAGGGDILTIRNVAPNSFNQQNIRVVNFDRQNTGNDSIYQTTSNNPAYDNDEQQYPAIYNNNDPYQHGMVCPCCSPAAINNRDHSSSSFVSSDALVAMAGIGSAGLLSVASASISHRQAKKDFYNTIGKDIRQQYQQQNDNQQEISEEEAYEKSGLGQKKKQYIKQVSTNWGTSSFISGAAMGSTAAGLIGAAIGLTLSTGGAFLAAAAVGLAVGAATSLFSYFTAKKVMTNRVDQKIANELASQENQQGLSSQDIKEKNNAEIALQQANDRVFGLHDKSAIASSQYQEVTQTQPISKVRQKVANASVNLGVEQYAR